ncbi:MAG: DUF4252 domain-containing protein [Candidatus Krumholzibacteriia bacterium]
MNTPRTLTAALLAVLLLAAAGAAAAQDLAKEPGYVDLEWIEIPDQAREIKDIDLSPMLLTFARDARENGDDALVQALAMVRSLRVKAFSLEPGLDAEVAATVEKVTDRLKKDKWQRLVYVKSDEETVSISTRYADDKLVGLMLVVFEPGDSAAFVNVVGDLDLGTLLRLAGEIDGDNLETMLEELEGVEGIEVHRNRDAADR